MELVSNEERTLRRVKWWQKYPENMWIPNCNIVPILLFILEHSLKSSI